MSPSSSMPTLLLLRTERKPGVLFFAATWLWTRQNTAALADLRTTLNIEATDDTIDADLRAAAEQRYDALLQWCIRTTARLEGTSVRNPAVWLTATVANLRQRHTAGDMTGLTTQVAMVDGLLRAAAPEDLIDAADTVSDYANVRAAIMADIADTN